MIVSSLKLCSCPVTSPLPPSCPAVITPTILGGTPCAAMISSLFRFLSFSKLISLTLLRSSMRTFAFSPFAVKTKVLCALSVPLKFEPKNSLKALSCISSGSEFSKIMAVSARAEFSKKALLKLSAF